MNNTMHVGSIGARSQEPAPRLEDMHQKLIAATAGAALSADAIALHGYREGRTPESLAESILTSRVLVKTALGDNRQIWMTEWGYSNPEITGSATLRFSGVGRRIFCLEKY